MVECMCGSVCSVIGARLVTLEEGEEDEEEVSREGRVDAGEAMDADNDRGAT